VQYLNGPPQARPRLAVWKITENNRPRRYDPCHQPGELME
jgi:hypothetical protein